MDCGLIVAFAEALMVKKADSKYSEDSIRELSHWVAEQTGHPVNAPLAEELKSGILLCR